jgi:hypothetical protein
MRRDGWRPRAATRPDSGMVTAEIAVALPALVLAMATFLSVIGLGVGQGTVAQAAREGARAAARGDSEARVRARVQDLAPGATVSINTDGRLVRVTAVVTPPLLLGLLPRPTWQLRSSVSALVERP